MDKDEAKRLPIGSICNITIIDKTSPFSHLVKMPVHGKKLCVHLIRNEIALRTQSMPLLRWTGLSMPQVTQVMLTFVRPEDLAGDIDSIRRGEWASIPHWSIEICETIGFAEVEIDESS